jgi:hypothetical protein
MSESVADTARSLSARGQDGIKQVRRMIRRLIDRHDTAAQLFLDPEDGQPTAAASKWFGQLAADNYVNGGAYHADPREHAYREGRRELALEIIGSARLDVEKLQKLTALEREVQ